MIRLIRTIIWLCNTQFRSLVNLWFLFFLYSSSFHIGTKKNSYNAICNSVHIHFFNCTVRRLQCPCSVSLSWLTVREKNNPCISNENFKGKSHFPCVFPKHQIDKFITFLYNVVLLLALLFCDFHPTMCRSMLRLQIS
jgi:hypothetical protein